MTLRATHIFVFLYNKIAVLSFILTGAPFQFLM